MAKCPVCRGKGYRLRIDDMRFAMAEIVKCESCDGKGVVEPMTEQEYIQTCTTEQLVDAIYECVMSNSWSFNKDGIKRWLKQPHREGV